MPKNKNIKSIIRKRIADTVDISKDVIMDTVLIKLTGNFELMVENYKGILEYNDKRIVVKANPRSVGICGSKLEIGTITDEMLFIFGDIKEVSFMND